MAIAVTSFMEQWVKGSNFLFGRDSAFARWLSLLFPTLIVGLSFVPVAQTGVRPGQ
jgi:hypothetical protein